MEKEKFIEGYAVNQQKVVDSQSGCEDTDLFLEKVSFSMCYDGDPLKVLVVDGDKQYTIPLGQLNSTIFHISKATAKIEIMTLWGSTEVGPHEVKVAVEELVWFAKSEENVHFSKVLSDISDRINTAGWDTQENKNDILEICQKELNRISDMYESQLP